MPNPNIKPLQAEDLPDDLKALYESSAERTGDATIIGVMGHHPDILRWYFDEFYGGLFYNAHDGMTVDVRTKELLRLKLSKQHGCQFCNRFNTVEAKKSGITDAMVDAIFDLDNEVWTDQDRAVLKLAEEMMLQNENGHLSQPLYDELRAHFDDRQIVELGFVAAVLTGVAKWIFTYDIVNREETCPIGPPKAA